MIPAVLFMVIGVWSVLAAIGALRKRPVRWIALMFWMFVFYFIFLAGFVQFRSGKFPWGAVHVQEDITSALLLIIVSLTAYWIGYRPFSSSLVQKTKLGVRTKFRINVTAKRWKILLIVFSISLVAFFFVSGFSIRDLASSRTEFAILVAELGVRSQFIYVVLRSPSAAMLLLALLILWTWKVTNRADRRTERLLLLIIAICLALNSPFVHSRAWAGAVYVSSVIILALIYRPHRERMLALLVSLAVFPLFILSSVFRHPRTEGWGFVWAGLTSGGFDAFSQIVNTYKYVDVHGLRWGYQLLGALFFWVPRSFWPEKPLGTGYMVHDALGFSFLNVSGPLWAEMYINFGVIGIFVGFFILGRISYSFDRRIAELRGSLFSPVFHAVAWFFVAYQWILLRGDLITFTSYFVPFLACLLILRYALVNRWGSNLALVSKH